MFCRAIDIQSLVGNIGGYIGLCLGYCFLQIPDHLQHCLTLIKKGYLHFSSNDSPTTIDTEAFEAEDGKISNDSKNQWDATTINTTDIKN